MTPAAFPSLKRVLLGLLLAALVLPALQTAFTLVPIPGLAGYGVRPPRPIFTVDSLLRGSYQPALEQYAAGHVGFRGAFIRLRNQLAYSLFRTGHARDVLVGEEGMLFAQEPIRAYLGQDFRGWPEVRRNVRRLRAVQDTLAHRRILLVFAIAPDKASFYPDYLPAYFRQQPRGQTNYAAYAREMHAQGINLVDLAALFQQWKDTAAYPLFPRGGIHWSGYGITLAADTLLRYIAQRGHLHLPTYTVTGRDVLPTARVTDADIASALNLLVQPAPFQMAYPRVRFAPPAPGQRKPRLLLVADSFGWSLIGFYPYLPSLFSSPVPYWYYNKAVVPGNPTQPGGPPVERPLDRRAEILQQQVVLLLFAQHNLRTFDSGFSASAYDIFCQPAGAAGWRR
ncbi:hypothetical protein K3G63_19185 [Hymenobacter sp. HSC-4F20]|uniref:alginate O-acetyltransferase AlgX-related protein n=1 Tax=Hymenobacter sp. HSC-4F20 TaxID=2864135 RepID=UPI001C72EACF|nr:hypothetical protein [Hymenobacter sp. HSC-4F20]MBX0292576.1 hypothetical protein [Hymenobacter sp. HSC-4F20]